jgi:hypothetical protein
MFWFLVVGISLLILSMGLTVFLLRLYVDLVKEQFTIRGELNMLMKMNKSNHYSSPNVFEFLASDFMSTMPTNMPIPKNNEQSEAETTTIEVEKN